MDFQFGLRKKQKEQLINDAQKLGIDIKLNTKTEEVSREELEEIRKLLSNDQAYDKEGRAKIHPNWIIIDKNNPEKPLVEIKRNNNKDVIEGGFILTFTGKNGVKGEKTNKKIKSIALMGAGASGTVVAPLVILMGSYSESWLNEDIKTKLKDINECGYQAVFKIKYSPHYAERPYSTKHIEHLQLVDIREIK